MAVFTPVSPEEAQQVLERFDLGELVSLRGIAAGIENTNYFVTSTVGEYVLTIFEKLTIDQLPFYIELMHHLAARGLPVPEPQSLRTGGRITELHGKPCTIVSRLPGGYEPAPTAKHCVLTARVQAHTHLQAQDFTLYQPNLRGLAWWQQTAPEVLPFLNQEQAALLTSEIEVQTEFAASDNFALLPSGPAHCDLFRDNVLFAGTSEEPVMGGIIVFYFAGCDTWLFDVAVAVNDWCIVRESGEFRPELLTAWLKAYANEREFTTAERQAWPFMLRAAALRFWLSRLYDYYLPRAAQTLKPHDPRHFERILRLRRRDPAPELP